MTETVTDNTSQQRFEMAAGGNIAFISYRRTGNAVALIHAEVPRALEGQGIGSKLAKGTLDLIRVRGEKVIPLCSFMAHFVAAHPEYRDLLASSHQDAVDESSEETFPASDAPGWVSGEALDGPRE